MQLHDQQMVYLVDAHQRQLGQIMVEDNEGDLIFGKFVPDSAFFAVERLFQDFEEAVNIQALSVVDELDTEIAALGLHLCMPTGRPQRIKVHDVQIWSDGNITCKLCDATFAPINGIRKSTEPVQVVEHPT